MPEGTGVMLCFSESEDAVGGVEVVMLSGDRKHKMWYV